MNAFHWALAAALCWGLAPLLEKAGLRTTADPTVGVFARTIGVLVGALCVLPFFPRVPQQLGELTFRTWVLLGMGGLLASIAGQICFYRALKMGEVSRIVPLGASYPVIACLLGIFLLKEPMTPMKTLGITLVVVGTYLLR